MNTKLTGIFKEGDTRDFKEWVEKIMGDSAERRSEISDLKIEMRLIRQSLETMQKKLDNIERILEDVAE
jgi:hypothetical protein